MARQARGKSMDPAKVQVFHTLQRCEKDLRLQEPFLIPVVYVGGAKRDYTAPIVLQMTVQVLPPLRQL